MLKVMIQEPNIPTVVSDEDVFDFLIEQLCELGEFSADENVLLIAPLGATGEQVEKALADIEEMEEYESEADDL